MKKIVFDIETVGFPMESLSESQQEYLYRAAEKEIDQEIKRQMKDEVERLLSLYPFTAKVVAIGMSDVESGKSAVYYESEEKEEWTNEEKDVKYIGLPEREMLESFWKLMERTSQAITFNGRGFDIPFLMLRSSVLKIKPSKNFMRNRYDTRSHIDLLEQFSYYGAVKRFNLDFYCNAYGVVSPKSKGVSGMEVKTLYEAGKIKEIAIYCGDDIIATAELYKIWNEYLNFE